MTGICTYCEKIFNEFAQVVGEAEAKKLPTISRIKDLLLEFEDFYECLSSDVRDLYKDSQLTDSQTSHLYSIILQFQALESKLIEHKFKSHETKIVAKVKLLANFPEILVRFL